MIKKTRGGPRESETVPYTPQPAAVFTPADPSLGFLWSLLDSGRRPIAWPGSGESQRPITAAPTPKKAGGAIVRRNLRRRMAYLHISPRALALEAGLNESAVRQILNGRSDSPRDDTLRAIAEILLCEAEDLTGANWFRGLDRETAKAMRVAVGHMFQDAEQLRESAETAPDTESKAMYLGAAQGLDFIGGPYEWEKTIGFSTNYDKTIDKAPDKGRGVSRYSDIQPREPVPTAFAAAPAPSGRDFPVYASAQGGSDGVQVLEWEPIEWVATPDPLTTVQGAFGVLIVDESMVPLYEHGDIAHVHPHIKPEPGRNALFIKRVATGETYMLVKRVVKETRDEWVVEQFNPPKRFNLRKTEWRQAMRITGKYDRR